MSREGTKGREGGPGTQKKVTVLSAISTHTVGSRPVTASQVGLAGTGGFSPQSLFARQSRYGKAFV